MFHFAYHNWTEKSLFIVTSLICKALLLTGVHPAMSGVSFFFLFRGSKCLWLLLTSCDAVKVFSTVLAFSLPNRWACIHFRSHPHASTIAITKASISPFLFRVRFSVLPYVVSFYVWHICFRLLHWYLPPYHASPSCEIVVLCQPYSAYIILILFKASNEQGRWAARTNFATRESPPNLHHKTTRAWATRICCALWCCVLN